MGEAKNNPNAIAKKAGELEGEKIADPISVESILIITDLAQIGLTHLKQMLPEIREVVGKGGAAITREQLNKFEELVEDGPEVITHFSNMSEYIRRAAKEIADAKKNLEVPNA